MYCQACKEEERGSRLNALILMAKITKKQRSLVKHLSESHGIDISSVMPSPDSRLQGEIMQHFPGIMLAKACKY